MSVNIDGDKSTKVTGLQLDTTDPQFGTAPTAAGLTVMGVFNPYRVHKVKVTFSALTAAATTQDLTLWTPPARTRIVRVIGVVNTPFTGGAISAMTIGAGKSAGGVEWLAAVQSVFTATVCGDVFADFGTGLVDTTKADYVAASTIVSVRFTSTGANVSAATAGDMDFYIESVTYP